MELGELKLKGEYLELKNYYSPLSEDLELIPAGTYLCCRKSYAQWGLKGWAEHVQKQIKSMGIRPRFALLEGVSMYLLSLEETIYELRILIEQ